MRDKIDNYGASRNLSGRDVIRDSEKDLGESIRDATQRYTSSYFIKIQRAIGLRKEKE